MLNIAPYFVLSVNKTIRNSILIAVLKNWIENKKGDSQYEKAGNENNWKRLNKTIRNITTKQMKQFVCKDPTVAVQKNVLF